MNVQNITDSVKNVWLAGLGVVSVSQKEIEKLYGNLVKEGQSFENKSKKQVNKLTDKAESKFDTLKKEAGKRINKIEGFFEGQIEKALKKLDVPTNDELKALNKRLEALTAEIKKIEKAA